MKREREGGREREGARVVCLHGPSLHRSVWAWAVIATTDAPMKAFLFHPLSYKHPPGQNAGNNSKPKRCPWSATNHGSNSIYYPCAPQTIWPAEIRDRIRSVSH